MMLTVPSIKFTVSPHRRKIIVFPESCQHRPRREVQQNFSVRLTHRHNRGAASVIPRNAARATERRRRRFLPPPEGCRAHLWHDYGENAASSTIRQMCRHLTHRSGIGVWQPPSQKVKNLMEFSAREKNVGVHLSFAPRISQWGSWFLFCYYLARWNPYQSSSTSTIPEPEQSSSSPLFLAQFSTFAMIRKLSVC